MSEPISELRRRLDAIRDALDRASPGDGAEARARVRDEIVSVFRETERMIDELAELKESIRPLVERYREIYRGPAPRPAERPEPPEPTGELSIRVDHLGSSTYLERGWNAIAAGDYDKAVDALERALELAPGNPRAEALLGWALMRAGRLSEARDLLERLLARDPDHELARTNLGYVCLREGRFPEAVEHLTRAARSGDRTAALYAHLYLGMLYSEREMYGDARGFLMQAIEMGPNLIEAYWELGLLHYRQGKAELASEIWRNGSENNRYDPWGERCGEALGKLQAGEPVSVE